MPNYEKIKLANGDETELHYIAGGDGLVAIHVITTPNTQPSTSTTFYTYTDHLGSILTLTNNVGDKVFETNFDAWGRRRNVDDWTYTNTEPFVETGYDFSWLTRGYTGHEHLTEFGLINMNGRIYDPILARMLSPDNYVQDATSTQGYNRYSYVINNPLKYTDPSGEFLSGIGAAVLSWVSTIGSATSSAVSSGVLVQGALAAGKVFAMAGIAYVSAATGAAVFSGFGVSATVGFNLYTFSAGVAGGATSGFIGGFSSSILGGSSLNNALLGGVKGSLIGGFIGGVSAGIAGGVNAAKIRGFFEKTNPVNDGALAFNEYALDASGNLVYMNSYGGNEQHIINYGKWYTDNGTYFMKTSSFVVDARNFASLSALTSTLAGLSGGATTNWGDVRDGSITTLAGSLSVIGGIAAIATGVGTPAGVAGISFGVPTIGFGIAKILDGFQGGARTIPGGLFEATDIGFGGNGNLGQMGDIFSSGLPKNVTDGFIMGYGFYNSNIGQSFFYNPTINSSHSSFPPLIIQKDNTNVVLPIIR